MIAGLITGSLFRAPECRTSKSGRQFVSAMIRVKGADGSMFASVVAFGDTAQSELMRLADGDAKIGLSIVANHVLTLRQPPKKRKPAAATDIRSREQRLAGSWHSPADGPNDELPF